MRIVEISNKVYLIRHWMRWYRVQRGGQQWDRLQIKPAPRTKSIAQIQKALAKQGIDKKAK